MPLPLILKAPLAIVCTLSLLAMSGYGIYLILTHAVQALSRHRKTRTWLLLALLAAIVLLLIGTERGCRAINDMTTSHLDWMQEGN